MPRSNNLHFVVSDAPFFDLFVVNFNTKADMEQWKRVIDSAKEHAPPLGTCLHFSFSLLQMCNDTRILYGRGKFFENIQFLF